MSTEKIAAKLHEWFPDWRVTMVKHQDPKVLQYKMVTRNAPATIRAEKHMRILDLGIYLHNEVIVYVEISLPLSFCRDHGIK